MAEEFDPFRDRIGKTRTWFPVPATEPADVDEPDLWCDHCDRFCDHSTQLHRGYA